MKNALTTIAERYKIPLHHELCVGTSFTGTWQMPIVKPYIGDTPPEIISFNRARTVQRNPQAAIHFYIADGYFNCVWNNPTQYIERFKWFYCLISTDFSVYADMLLPEVLWNSFRNKLLAVWWQKLGLQVIPNVSWQRQSSYDFCFDGLPKHSVIAINSTGIRRNPFSKRLWIEGYNEAIKRLEPIKIIRYGAKQTGEYEDISVYYPNDNFKSAHYGR